MLCGWPTDTKLFVYVQEHFINPHIILVFIEDKEKAIARFEELDGSNH